MKFSTNLLFQMMWFKHLGHRTAEGRQAAEAARTPGLHTAQPRGLEEPA